jgi:hypothetical protein
MQAFFKEIFAGDFAELEEGVSCCDDGPVCEEVFERPRACWVAYSSAILQSGPVG